MPSAACSWTRASAIGSRTRRRGRARSREIGAVTVEAYPATFSACASDEEGRQGPEAVFPAEGFEAVQGRTPPYPVLRRSTWKSGPG